MNYVLLKLRFTKQTKRSKKFFIVCEYKGDIKKEFFRGYIGDPIIANENFKRKIKGILQSEYTTYKNLINNFYTFDKFLTEEAFWKKYFCNLLKN